MPAAPFARLDHVVIAVRDLQAGMEAYAAMLGREPSWLGRHPAYGTANALFGLDDCYLELLARDDSGTNDHPIAATLDAYLAQRNEGLFALALGSDDLVATRAALMAAGLSPGPIHPGEGRDAAGGVRRWRSFVLDQAETRGIALIAIEHDAMPSLAPAAPRGDVRAAVLGIDHVVLFSDDFAGALALWDETFGVRERWRREFPDRGTVNVGLRLGGVTLELVAPLGRAVGGRGERAWGIAYTVADVDAAVARLRTAGVAASDAREGAAPGTRVATVKWGDRLPTLLIQPRRRHAQV